MKSYSLDIKHYTWGNALLWGNFIGHCKKAQKGTLGHRSIHALIAIAEFLPVISQIVSIFEKIIVESYAKKVSSQQLIQMPHLGATKGANQTSSPLLVPDNKPICPEDCPADLAREVKEPDEQDSKRIIFENHSEDIDDSSDESCDENEYENVNDDLNEINIEIPKYLTREKPIKQLIPLRKEFSNGLIKLNEIPEWMKVNFYSKNATFYAYCSESVDDHGWGCAWRAIQTSLSVYNIHIPFNELFLKFGSEKILKLIYKAKYPNEQLANNRPFAPYDLECGWAEPFIGQMVMSYYGIPSSLETVNNIPYCYAPPQVFHNPPLSFNEFLNKMENHFQNENAAPLMIDDGKYACNIVGIERNDGIVTLLMADPHIERHVNQSSENPPIGIYTILFDEEGNQIATSLDEDQIHGMYAPGHHESINFAKKGWMVLFPS